MSLEIYEETVAFFLFSALRRLAYVLEIWTSSLTTVTKKAEK